MVFPLEFSVCYSDMFTDWSSDIASNQADGDVELTDENSMSNGFQDASSDQGQTLPILQKIIDLSTKIQVNSK